MATSVLIFALVRTNSQCQPAPMKARFHGWPVALASVTSRCACFQAMIPSPSAHPAADAPVDDQCSGLFTKEELSLSLSRKHGGL